MTGKTALDDLEPLLRRMNEKLRDASMYQRNYIQLPMMELVQLVGAASRALPSAQDKTLSVQAIPMTEEIQKMLSVTREVSIPGVAEDGPAEQARRTERGWQERALIAERNWKKCRRWAIAAGVEPDKLGDDPQQPWNEIRDRDRAEAGGASAWVRQASHLVARLVQASVLEATAASPQTMRPARVQAIEAVRHHLESVAPHDEALSRTRALIDAARATLLTHYAHLIEGATEAEVEAAMVAMRIAADAADLHVAPATALTSALPSTELTDQQVDQLHEDAKLDYAVRIGSRVNDMVTDTATHRRWGRALIRYAIKHASGPEPVVTGELAKFRKEQLRQAAVALRNAGWPMYAEEVERATRTLAASGFRDAPVLQKSKATLTLPVYLGNVKSGLLVDGLNELLRDVGGMKVEYIDLQMPSCEESPS